MATYSCHWLIMGKVHIGIYCCLTTDILTKVLQKCSLSSTLHVFNIWILSKLLNLIVPKVKFAKKYLLRSHKGDEAEVHNIGLNKNCVFLLPLLMFFCCYVWQLSFHRLIMWKVKIGLNSYLTADILTKVLQKCSLSSPVVQTAEFDWLSWQPKD